MKLHRYYFLIAFLLVPFSIFAQTFFQTGQSPAVILSKIDIIQQQGIRPLTNGNILVATSSEDSKVAIWRNMPRQNAQEPDKILATQPAGSIREFLIWGNNVLVAYKSALGFAPTFALSNTDTLKMTVLNDFNNTFLRDIQAAAIDDRFAYAADSNFVYVLTIPTPQKPLDTFRLTFPSNNRPRKVKTDGETLTICTAKGEVHFYDILTLKRGDLPFKTLKNTEGVLGFASDALVRNKQVFIADNKLNRIVCWEKIEALGDTSKMEILEKPPKAAVLKK